MDIIGNIFKGKSGKDKDGIDFETTHRNIYDFDPSGLERAAKSAQILKDNPHADKVLDLALKDIQSKTSEIQKQKLEYEYKIEQAKAEGMKQQHQYALEILKEEAKTHRTKAEYEDFLARKRYEDRAEHDKKFQLEFLNIQEQSIKRQEEERRKTIDYEVSQRKFDEDKFSAQFWKNKALYRKETKDIYLDKFQRKLANKLERTKLSYESIRNMFSSTFIYFKDNPLQFLKLTAGVIILVTGYTVAKRGTTIGLRKYENFLFTPKLIKETNVKKFPFLFNITTSPSIIKGDFKNHGLIYDSKTENLLLDVVQSTKYSINNQGLLRNFLFYGPPGTGKTLFAKKLAISSGLNYAILTGGDVLPLKENAVTELHNVFDWSKRKKGLILFMDEADAFLKKRDRVEIGEEMRSAMNTFLYKTGDGSKNMMLILATNKPEQLDSAVTDRIDTMIKFNLPDEATRILLFKFYLKKHLNKDDDKLCEELAEISVGFSAREISKFCYSLEIHSYTKKSMEMTNDEIVEHLHLMMNQHEQKKTWETY